MNNMILENEKTLVYNPELDMDDAEISLFDKNKIEVVIIPSNVNELYEHCFSGFSNLREVRFMKDSTLKKIGDGAFEECSSLKDIRIPDSCEKIEGSVFQNSGISHIHIGRNMEYFDPICLSDTSIETIDIDIRNPFYTDRNSNGVFQFFNDKYTLVVGTVNTELDNKVNTIGTYSFSGRKNLKTITLSESIVEIQESAFIGCDSLKMIDLGKVNSIGKDAFYDCYSLDEVVWSDEIISIEEGAFRRTGIGNLQLGPKFHYLIPDAFIECFSLNQIYVSDLNEEYYSSKDGTALITKKEIHYPLFIDCDSYGIISAKAKLEPDTLVLGTNNCIIPESVKRLGRCCLNGRLGERLVIPDTLYAIDDYAIELPELTAIIIPKSVRFLGELSISADLVYTESAEMHISRFNFMDETLFIAPNILVTSFAFEIRWNAIKGYLFAKNNEKLIIDGKDCNLCYNQHVEKNYKNYINASFLDLMELAIKDNDPLIKHMLVKAKE